MQCLRYIETDVTASDSHHEPQKMLSSYLREGTNSRLRLEFNVLLQTMFHKMKSYILNLTDNKKSRHKDSTDTGFVTVNSTLRSQWLLYASTI